MGLVPKNEGCFHAHNLPISTVKELVRRLNKLPIDNTMAKKKEGDPRLVAGEWVHTYAKCVWAEAECQRRFGALWATAKVDGKVISHRSFKPEGKRQTQTMIMVEWAVNGGSMRLKEVLKRNIKAGKAPDDDPAPTLPIITYQNSPCLLDLPTDTQPGDASSLSSDDNEGDPGDLPPAVPRGETVRSQFADSDDDTAEYEKGIQQPIAGLNLQLNPPLPDDAAMFADDDQSDIDEGPAPQERARQVSLDNDGVSHQQTSTF